VNRANEDNRCVSYVCVCLPSICSSCSSCSLCSSSFSATNLVNPWRSGHTQGVTPHHVNSLGKGELLYFSREREPVVNQTWPPPFINPGQSHMTISCYKSGSITHDHPISFGSTLQVLRTTAVPRQYPPCTPSDTFLHFFKKLFIKPKPDIGQCSDLSNHPWPRTRLFE
jgi:hypothetical protein